MRQAGFFFVYERYNVRRFWTNDTTSDGFGPTITSTTVFADQSGCPTVRRLSNPTPDRSMLPRLNESVRLEVGQLYRIANKAVIKLYFAMVAVSRWDWPLPILRHSHRILNRNHMEMALLGRTISSFFRAIHII
jgi:hypothetical protein